MDILVVDDHPLFRQGVVSALVSAPGVRLVREAGSGQEALEMALSQIPDVAVIDVNMPGWSGVVTAEKLAMACPATAIVMLTGSENKSQLLDALKAGARGYVLKGVSGAELMAVIRSTLAGEVFVSPSIASEMLLSLTRSASLDPLQELTPREREILALIGNGLTNRAIGESLHLSEKTIKHYVTNILQKLQVRSRVEAALMASRHARQDRS